MPRKPSPPPNYDYTGAQRKQRMRDSGRRIDTVITDATAIAAYEQLLEIHGTPRAVLEALLHASITHRRAR